MNNISIFKKNKTSAARLLAVESTYAHLMGGTFDRNHSFEGLNDLTPDSRLLNKIEKGVVEFEKELSNLIEKNAHSEKLDTLAKSILLCALFEKKHLNKATGILVTEYKQIATLFYGIEKASFIQAILNQ